MERTKNYIRRDDFHNGKLFTKVNKDIDTCLALISRLISQNDECLKMVVDKLKVPDYIIDYRIAQFDFYRNALISVYYSCYSLKHVYDISTYMNFKGIDNTIMETLDNQRRFNTFNAIIRLQGMFEFSRREFEETLDKKNYFQNMKEKYPEYSKSLELLNNFRNTVHNNGKWNKDNDLVYELRAGTQTIKKGRAFVYDHWKLYRIVKDCLDLHKLLALDNVEVKVRETHWQINGERIATVKTEMTLEDWDILAEQSISNKKIL